jgi:peroxiredoxin
MNKKKILKTLLIIAIPLVGFGVATAVYNNKNAVVDRKAPDFTLADTSGNNVTLSSFKGKYVLLDFWASWCKDCRIENKNLVKVYNKYKKENLVVLSVSLDFDEDNWKNTIAIDGLAWPNHVSDLQKWKSPVAKLYNVRAIPAVFLIDTQGNIIAEDLTGSVLEEKLATVFAKQ